MTFRNARLREGRTLQRFLLPDAVRNAGTASAREACAAPVNGGREAMMGRDILHAPTARGSEEAPDVPRARTGRSHMGGAHAALLPRARSFRLRFTTAGIGAKAGLAATGLAAVLLMGTVPSGSAWAQARSMFPTQSAPVPNILSLLFGGLKQAPRYDEPDRPRIPISPRLREPAVASGGSFAYCVRTCDGRFFPLQGRAGDAGSALAQCNAFCPAARMAVYTTSDSTRGIDGAVTREGKAYTELPNAYVFRQRLVEGCTCTSGTRIGGLGAMDVKEDPTLRRGDFVMTAEGGRVFAGARKGPPYRDADFVPPARFPDLSRDMKARLAELEVASQ